MTTLTNAVLQKSSAARLIEAANFKHSGFLVLVEDNAALGLKKNAELIDVQPYNLKPYTAKAIFRVDREANTLPFNEQAPSRQFHNRSILIRQIAAQDIVDRFGINGVVYLDLGEDVPETTSGLAARFKELFGLEMTAADIVDQQIARGATCILVRFNPKSVGFKGALRVDIATPVLATP